MSICRHNVVKEGRYDVEMPWLANMCVSLGILAMFGVCAIALLVLGLTLGSGFEQKWSRWPEHSAEISISILSSMVGLSLGVWGCVFFIRKHNRLAAPVMGYQCQECQQIVLLDPYDLEKRYRHRIDSDGVGYHYERIVPPGEEAFDALKSPTEAQYMGGHPSDTKLGPVIVGCNEIGVCVHSPDDQQLLFSIPWSSVAKVQHIHVPKNSQMDQSAMTVALYGASGRGGAFMDMVATAGALKSMFEQDKHFLSVTMRTPDGFEGGIAFESAGCKDLATVLSSERLRYGQRSPVAAQAPTPRPALTVTATDTGIAGKLKELTALRDAGVVTAEEFAAKKAELLARL